MRWLRQRLEQMHFQSQLLLLVLLPLLFLAATVTLVAGYALRTSTRDLILQRNTTLVNLAASSTAQELRSYLRPLQTAAENLASSRPADRQQLLQEQYGYLDVFDGGVTLLDAGGNAVASTPGATNRLGLNYSFRPYFQQVQASLKPVYSTVIVEQPSGQQAVVIAIPALSGQRFSGVLIGVFFLQRHLWVSEFEVLQTQDGRPEVYLVDAVGNIIYHPDLERIGGSITSEPELTGLLIARQPHSVIYTSAQTGTELVASYAPLPGTDWSIIMQEPWQALVAPNRGYLWFLVGFMILGLGLSVIMLLVGLKRGMRPLQGLMDVARKVSAGESFQPMAEAGPSELRTLIGSFNQMVTSMEKQQETLRSYAMQVVQSQEEERRRISRELHDETVQDLVGLSQRLELTRSALVRDPAAARLRLDELQALTERALADVRRMSNDLRPLILEDLGLAAAVNRLCRSLSNDLPGADVSYSVEGYERRPSPEVELVVFRVLQEAMTNIRKHARLASRVEVRLSFTREDITAVVMDNGEGFQVESIADAMRQGHLGLAGMLERTRLFKGELTIQAEPGKGTTVSLCLPA